MDIDNYIKDDLNFQDIDDVQFINFYGSSLREMVRFGQITESSSSGPIFEEAKFKSGLDFFQDIENIMRMSCWTHEAFLLSKDSDGDIFLLKNSLTDQDMQLIMILCHKHKMTFEIKPSALDINFLEIWFFDIP